MDYSGVESPSKYKEWIVECIQEYPLIQYKKLEEYFCKSKKKHMAKETLSKYLKELINEKKVYKFMEGKAARYDLASSYGMPPELMKKQFNEWVSKIRKSIEKMEHDYERYNVYMKVNAPDYLKSVYRSLENVHKAFANPEDYSYEDLGTWERILCNEILKATEGNKDDESIIEKRIQARKLRDQIVVLKKEDHVIYKKLKPGIKNVNQREKLRSKGKAIGAQISKNFEALHEIHRETVKE